VKELALVFVGGGLGSSLRFGADWLLKRLWPEQALAFPWATLAVNFIGCFAIGLGVGLLPKETENWGPELRSLLLVGVCGGLTTFSAFANQTLALGSGKALINVALSVAGGLALAWLGLTLAGARTA
jgi:fluoride exporter